MRNGGIGDVGGGGAGATLQNQLLSNESSLLKLHWEIVDFRAHHEGLVMATKLSFAVVNGNIRCVAMQLARRCVAANEQAAEYACGDTHVVPDAVAATAADLVPVVP